MLFSYEWDERFTGGWLSDGGKITGIVGDKQVSPSGRTQNCIVYTVDWFQKVSNGTTSYTSYLDSQYHTYCTTTQTFPKVTDVLGYTSGGGGTTSGGTGSGSTYEEELPCEGEYTGRDGTCRTTAWNIAALRRPQVIVNNLTIPCLRNMLEFMRYQVFELDVQRILIEFNKSLDNTYTFSQFIGHPAEDGREFRDGTYSFQIELNSTALANASREYVAATIYHEILHTYLTVEGGVARDLNHQEMATRFIRPMADALIRLFPGSLTQADAEALAWGGLGETAAWQTLVRNDLNNGTNVTANISLTNNRYKNLNNSYGNAYGTVCN